MRVTEGGQWLGNSGTGTTGYQSLAQADRCPLESDSIDHSQCFANSQ